MSSVWPSASLIGRTYCGKSRAPVWGNVAETLARTPSKAVDLDLAEQVRAQNVDPVFKAIGMQIPEGRGDRREQ